MSFEVQVTHEDKDKSLCAEFETIEKATDFLFEAIRRKSRLSKAEFDRYTFIIHDSDDNERIFDYDVTGILMFLYFDYDGRIFHERIDFIDKPPSRHRRCEHSFIVAQTKKKRLAAIRGLLDELNILC